MDLKWPWATVLPILVRAGFLCKLSLQEISANYKHMSSAT
jgi:hypothetical protein